MEKFEGISQEQAKENFIKSISAQTGKTMEVLLKQLAAGERTGEEVKQMLLSDIDSVLMGLSNPDAKY